MQPSGFPSPPPPAMPIGSITAFAGYIDPPQSLPKEGDKYNSGLAPQQYGIQNIEAYGWMVCDGRPLAIAAYPELFQILGFRYSQAGDKYSIHSDPSINISSDATFRIPDYRGYFLRMVSGTAPWPKGKENPDPDAESRVLPDGTIDSGVGSIQDDALQDHQHVYNKISLDDKAVNEGGNLTIEGQELSEKLTGSPTDVSPPSRPPGNVRVSSETRAKNMSVYYLIKYH